MEVQDWLLNGRLALAWGIWNIEINQPLSCLWRNGWEIYFSFVDVNILPHFKINHSANLHEISPVLSLKLYLRNDWVRASLLTGEKWLNSSTSPQVNYFGKIMLVSLTVIYLWLQYSSAFACTKPSTCQCDRVNVNKTRIYLTLDLIENAELLNRIFFLSFLPHYPASIFRNLHEKM